MKPLQLLCLLILATLANACSIAEQDASQVGSQIQQGLLGRGRIAPITSDSDPLNSRDPALN